MRQVRGFFFPSFPPVEWVWRTDQRERGKAGGSRFFSWCHILGGTDRLGLLCGAGNCWQCTLVGQDTTPAVSIRRSYDPGCEINAWDLSRVNSQVYPALRTYRLNMSSTIYLFFENASVSVDG